MTLTAPRPVPPDHDALPDAPPDRPTGAPPARSRAAALLRGRTGDARWVRPALLVLLLGTGVLYVWDLSASGWANSFYSAAVQAGSESWKAFFYGSSDAANSITVDKTPAALWVMALSVRIFGLSSWSILVPEALMGVASVGLVYLTVRRWYGAGAGLLAGTALALTPVAALMFRFDNPDALLVLLMTFAAYATLRAAEKASARWLVLVGVLLGFGFLTKMLQALLVLPAFALVYLLVAPTRLRTRVVHLLAAGAALVVSAGWWIAIVELVPAADRPYIGGSQTNSILELVLGYNGLGRLTGDETGSVGGGNGWGETGLTRLFDAEIGGQIAWLLPAALVLALVGVVLARRAPRTDLRRAGYLLWGGWLVVTGLVFSLMAGIFHAYYTVALAPAVAALVGMGVADLWRRRDRWWASLLTAGLLAGTAVWSFVLLSRSSDFLPWLRWAVLVGGAVAAVGLAVQPLLSRGSTAATPVRRAVATLAVVVGLAGPTAYTVQTVGTAHTGSIVTAGPTVAGAQGGPGGGGGFRGGAGGPGGGGQPPGGFGGQAPGGAGTGTGTGTGAGTTPTGQGRGTGMGGLLDSSTPSSELVAALESDASSYTWVAAAVGSQNASGYQLATGEPVMAVGGFNGSDPSPTLAQFQQYVADGRIHWFIASGGVGGGRGGSDSTSTSAQITAWVEANFTGTTVGGVTLYDLSA